MAEVDETLKERGSRYGKFSGHASVSQGILYEIKRGFAANTSAATWDNLQDDQKEALQMIAHKIGRIANGDPNYADSWIDIAGYAKLVADRLEEDQEKLKQV
jgi:hypothetical protein